jgi:predicted N-acetyltransferase YhbS
MTNPDDRFTLRAMQPSDSAAVAALIADFDSEMVTRFQIDAYQAIIAGTKYQTLGVVVESEGHDGLIGMGTVRFSSIQFNGQVLPLAFLDGLKVHQDYRRQGLGYRIAAWRIEQARELFGDACVIATGMASDNQASRAVAKKWCREFIDPAFEVFILPARSRPPGSLDGITVRAPSLGEYQEFSDRQNDFYQDYNFYEPVDVSSLEMLFGIAPEGKRPYRLYVAVDGRGNLLAGALTYARGILKVDQLKNPPVPLRALNRLFHLVPADFTIKDVAVYSLWHMPGHINSAHHLWETIRWECRDQGTTIIIGYGMGDPRGEVVRLKPWHQPRPKITIALHGHAPLAREKPFFVFGRV